MTNNIKNNLRPYHGSNYGCKYSNSSLNGNNLSLIANVSSSVAQMKRSVKEHASLSISFSDVTPVITHLLAFFVPDNSAASQAVLIPSSTTLRAHLSASRGHSLISIASHLLTDYDGLTLQNKIAVRRICRAVTNVTESKTRHPILLPYSVALTQKTLGGIHA